MRGDHSQSGKSGCPPLLASDARPASHSKSPLQRPILSPILLRRPRRTWRSRRRADQSDRGKHDSSATVTNEVFPDAPRTTRAERRRPQHQNRAEGIIHDHGYSVDPAAASRWYCRGRVGEAGRRLSRVAGADPDPLPGADEIGHPPRSLEELILEPHLGTDGPQLDPALADGGAESFPLLGRETCRTRDAVHLLYETSTASSASDKRETP